MWRGLVAYKTITYKGQKTIPDTLEPEIWAIVSHPTWVLGTKLEFSPRTAHDLNYSLLLIVLFIVSQLYLVYNNIVYILNNILIECSDINFSSFICLVFVFFFLFLFFLSRTQWHMPVILALERQKKQAIFINSRVAWPVSESGQQGLQSKTSM